MAASQSRMVPLLRAVSDKGLAVGAERRVDAALALMRKSWTGRLAGGGVPEPRRPVRLPVRRSCRRG